MKWSFFDSITLSNCSLIVMFWNNILLWFSAINTHNKFWILSCLWR